MKFPDISLTFAPFQNFPDIFPNSLTIPWPWKNKFFPDFSLTCGNHVMDIWFHMDFIWMSLQVHRTKSVSSLLLLQYALCQHTSAADMPHNPTVGHTIHAGDYYQNKMDPQWPAMKANHNIFTSISYWSCSQMTYLLSSKLSLCSPVMLQINLLQITHYKTP